MRKARPWTRCAMAGFGLALALAGCNERSGVEPAPALPTTLLRTYSFTGRVVNDAGDPVPAQVTYAFEPTSISIDLSQAVTYTDSAGRYTIKFTARLGGLDEKGDTTGAFAIAQVSSAGYEEDARYVLPSSVTDPANFLLHPVQ